MGSDFDTYKRGLADGQEALFERVMICVLEEDYPHPADCDCRACRLVTFVWGEAMRTVQEMIGPEESQRLGHALAKAAARPPRHPFSK